MDCRLEKSKDNRRGTHTTYQEWNCKRWLLFHIQTEHPLLAERNYRFYDLIIDRVFFWATFCTFAVSAMTGYTKNRLICTIDIDASVRILLTQNSFALRIMQPEILDWHTSQIWSWQTVYCLKHGTTSSLKYTVLQYHKPLHLLLILLSASFSPFSSLSPFFFLSLSFSLSPSFSVVTVLFVFEPLKYSQCAMRVYFVLG